MDIGQTSPEKQNQTLNSNKPIGLNSNLVATIITVSLMAGAIGGGLGSLYIARNPSFQKFLENKGNKPETHRISLTEDSAIIDVVNKAAPAVVSIVVSKDLNKLPGFNADPFGQDPFFQFFGFSNPGRRRTGPNVQQVAAGTGFFVSSDGTILTNRHVVSDETASYTVLTNDGKTYDAKILSRDPVSDLAILKIEIKNAPTLQLAGSSQIQIGQRVVAIGNSLGQYQNTVTSGIVSGIGRSITAGGNDGAENLEGVIQTDTAINPGNSGGPLLNILAQVIGINTAIDQEGQLVGFAIPSSDAEKALESFKKYGKITRPFLGIRYVMITKLLAENQKLPRDHGALIVRGQSAGDLAVLPGSPADKFGLKENDIILEINGTPLDEKNSLSRLLRNYNVGDEVDMKVYDGGQEKIIRLKLGEKT